MTVKATRHGLDVLHTVLSYVKVCNQVDPSQVEGSSGVSVVYIRCIGSFMMPRLIAVSAESITSRMS